MNCQDSIDHELKARRIPSPSAGFVARSVTRVVIHESNNNLDHHGATAETSRTPLSKLAAFMAQNDNRSSSTVVGYFYSQVGLL